MPKILVTKDTRVGVETEKEKIKREESRAVKLFEDSIAFHFAKWFGFSLSPFLVRCVCAAVSIDAAAHKMSACLTYLHVIRLCAP